MSENSEQRYLVNKTYDEIKVGDSASLTRILMPEDVKLFAVLTGDFNDFDTQQRFDRVVSVEMFEHLRNWPRAFAKVAGWLLPGS